MSTTETSRDTEGIGTVDLKLEVVVIPVSDVDRSKAFYGRLGWRLDADLSADNGFRSCSSPRRTQGAPSNSERT